MEQPETKIQRAIQARIKAIGGDSWKVHGNALQRSGEPDLCGEIPTEWGWVHIKWEVKTPKGKPSPIQLVRLRRYWKRGYFAAILTSADEVDRLVTAWEQHVQGSFIGNPRTWQLILADNDLNDEWSIYE